MPQIRMYSSSTCPYCIRAENFLNKKGAKVDKIMVDSNPQDMQKMREITGRHTVPQIFIGDTHVGGYDDLVKLDSEGKLTPLLQAS